MKGKKFEIE